MPPSLRGRRYGPSLRTATTASATSGGSSAGTQARRPDAPEGESLFVHKLAAARRLKGRGAAAAMLDWARARASDQGRAYLRLDCAADRPKLCRFYEGYGFRRVGRRMVGRYDTAFYEMPLR